MKDALIEVIKSSALFDFVEFRINENLELDNSVTYKKPTEAEVDDFTKFFGNIRFDTIRALIHTVLNNIEETTIDYLANKFAFDFNTAYDINELLDSDNVITNMQVCTWLMENEDFIKVYNDMVDDKTFYKAGIMNGTNIYVNNLFSWSETKIIPYKKPIILEFNLSNIEETESEMSIKYAFKISE